MVNPRHHRSPRNQTVNGAFPEWYAGKGIFSAFASGPWDPDIIPADIDKMYHGYHSGMKFCSPFLYYFMDENGEIPVEDQVKIATAIMSTYGNKWEHLWSLYTTEYGPLDSYALTEQTTRSGSGTNSGTDTKTYNVSDTAVHPTRTVSKQETRTPNITEAATLGETTSSSSSETRTPNLSEGNSKTTSGTKGTSGTDTTQHGHVVTTAETVSNQSSAGKHGFNSAESVPTVNEQSSGTTNSTETNSGTDTLSTSRTETDSETVAETKTTTGTDERVSSASGTKSGSETRTRTGTESATGSESEQYTGTDSLTKTGTETLGVQASRSESETVTSSKSGRLFKSPAELLEADRSFWLLDYFAIVFDDVDSVIALSIYSDKPVRHLVLDE